MAISARRCPQCLEPLADCVCDDDRDESWREIPFTSPEPDAA